MIKVLISKYQYNRFLALCLASCLLTGCNGLFDGIYDEPPSDETLQLGFNQGESPNRFSIVLDARDYDEWIYLDLHRRTITTMPIPNSLTGEWDGKSQWAKYSVYGSRYEQLELRQVDTQPEPEAWDMAIHHFDVRTNGGAVLRTDYHSIADLPSSSQTFADEAFVPDQWTMHQCIVDFSSMFDHKIWYQTSDVNLVLSEWVRMDFSTPPPKYEASNRLYLLRMDDDTVAALRLRSYMSEAGTKGFLTIDVVYPY